MNWESGVSEMKSIYAPKLAESFNVKIEDLFKENASNIVITQNNSDNKDNSVVNGISVLLHDKEAMDEIVNVIKKRKESKN